MDAKRALLARLLRERVGGPTPASPLAYSQQALWFLHRLAPLSPAYNVLFSARVRSAIDVPALRHAFETLSDRHPLLRTTYTAGDGGPVQQVHALATFTLLETDASAWDEHELKARLDEDARRPFDLEQGPVLRVGLFTREARDHILLVTVHHIACDFWSLVVLLDELGVLYRAYATGAPSSLPSIVAHYSDYVSWQAAMLASPEGDRLRRYWLRQLADASTTLDLPTDRPRPAAQTYRGASHPFSIDEGLTRRVKALARAEGATLYMTLLATFQVLVHRYSGQDDILVGSPVGGRNRREFAGIAGDFINPVPMRADLSGNPTFATFLARVRQTVVDALKHQEYPFSLLVEQLALPHDPSRSPLFQVMFLLQKAHRLKGLADFLLPGGRETDMDWGGLTLKPFALPQQEAQVDVTLEMIETGGTLTAVLKYNTDLFDAGTIARMAGHFRTLLAGVAADPARPLAALPLLPSTERQQALVDWNATAAACPRGRCVHQLFEEQAGRTPNAIAVVCEDDRLTYAELDQRANRLARHLQTLGVGPETLVGLCVERTVELVVSLLAILKAGGAYVPLDPTYPRDRLAFMLRDAGVQALVTQQRLLARLPAHEARVVRIDADRALIARESAARPVGAARPDNVAYVLYTSGSTGAPKGVMVTHGNVCNFLHAMRQEPGLCAQDRLLAVTTLSFDIAALEMYLPLIVGACLEIIGRDIAADGARLGARLHVSGATVLQATPATWRLLLEAGWQGKADLRMLCGGETLPAGLARALLDKGAALWNLYGPTETTIWSTVTKVESGEVGEGKESVPIGRPIANTQVYVLDRHMRPVPIGVAGELYIGGDGVARGYRGQPALTAERFVPNPFDSEPGARLYRTGDRARYRADGMLEYLGRLDHQIKLRGFRIELGEVEAVLQGHPAARQSVVMAREDTPGNVRLVAYVVPREERAGEAFVGVELRRHAATRLPAYMVPSTIIALPAFPLTANGKIDRRALPAPGPERRLGAGPREGEAPGHPLHQTLIGIWEEVLDIRPVGLRDDFFALGGHSLLAVRLLDRIERAYGRTVPLQALFTEATVAHVAAILLGEGDDKDDNSGDNAGKKMGDPAVAPPGVIAIRARTPGSQRPLFFLHGDVYGGYYCRKIAPHLEPDRPFYALPPVGLDGTPAPDCVGAIAARHVEALRAVQPDGPYLLGGFCNGGIVAYEMAQQLEKQGQRIDLLLLIDTTPTKDDHALVDVLARRVGPLLRWDAQRERTSALALRYGLARLRDFRQQGWTRRATSVHNIVRGRAERLREVAQAAHDGFGSDPADGRAPRGADSVMWRQQLLRAYWSAWARYTPEPYVGRVTLLWPQEDAARARRADPTLEWRALAAEVDVHMIPGTHETCTTTHIESLAACVAACTTRSSPPREPRQDAE